MKILSVFLFLLLTRNVFACDCKTLSKEKEYQVSDFIFLGKVISVNDTSFEVHVQEVFKGDNVEYTKISVEDCSIYPKRGELWLMYSEQRGNNKFYVSHCGWSRSFNNPFRIMDKNIPDPLSPGEPVDSSSVFPDIKKASMELKEDIVQLRIKREDSIKSKQWYFLGISVAIALVLILIFKRFKF